MAIKNLLVAFNGNEASESALHVAARMQKKYGAHVTGLLAHEGRRDRFAARSWVPDNVRGILQKSIAAEEAEVEARFRKIVADAPQDRVHWISLAGKPDGTVAQYACMYDLTIVGTPLANDRSEDALHPERIALKSGRPVLIVPSTVDPDSMNRPTVLAWDGQRAAARAMNDAMLILETKQQVDVLSIGDIRPSLQGIDVIEALERHGITCQRVRRDGSVHRAGRDILTYCKEIDAGLLVMGAFEHSVFREELLGGTTSTVLRHMTLPVLMSH
ncbi:universal stress protein [Tritonibacter mobilis]|nr:universal stress protein [Tritonibacter mobilis]